MRNKDVLKGWLHSGVSTLLALGLLAGCAGEEPEPTFTPTLPDSTPSPDENPEPNVDVDPVDEREPPEIPEFSDDPAKAAQQLVEFFTEAYHYGYDASDPALLIEIAHSDCGTCSLHVDRMLEQRETGQHSAGGKLHLQDYDIHLLDEDEILINAEFQQDPWVSYNVDGQVIEEADSKTVLLDFVLYVEDSEWQIRAISNVGDREK